VRDGAAARAGHDYLYTHRSGKVSATLNILSVDLITNTLVLSRNSRCPMIVVTAETGIRSLDEAVEPIGVRRGTKPSITELPLTAGTWAIVYTDGLERAGSWSSPVFDIPETAAGVLEEAEATAETLADALLDRALELEDGRPRDDISVLVLHVADRRRADDVRRLRLRVPLQ
jgi:serine phosphatase RsbU (regulator of sigma subunit)